MAEVAEKKDVAFEDIVFKGFAKLTPAQAAVKASQTESWVPEGGEEQIVYTQEGHRKYLKSFESTVQEQFKVMEAQIPFPEGLSTRIETVTYTAAFPGSDIHGSECSVEIAVYEPEAGIEGERLGMMYIHGGGMGIFDGREPLLNLGSAMYATQGCVGIVVRFTNSTEAPFPRGLLDCVEAVKWAKANLNLAGLCVYGESGGGNLTLATGMYCKNQDGMKDLIDCLYIQCPFLFAKSVNQETPDDIKGSEEEFMENMKGSEKLSAYMGVSLKEMYTPSGSKYVKDPLAWPYYATLDDLKGLPPTFVVNNECDTIADQGIRLHRQLARAGVACAHTVVSGTCHGMEAFNMMFASLQSSQRKELLKYAMYAKGAAVAAES